VEKDEKRGGNPRDWRGRISELRGFPNPTKRRMPREIDDKIFPIEEIVDDPPVELYQEEGRPTSENRRNLRRPKKLPKK